MKTFLDEIIKSFGQSVWTLMGLGSAVLVHVALGEANYPTWMQWAAALSVILIFGVVYVFVPRPWDED